MEMARGGGGHFHVALCRTYSQAFSTSVIDLRRLDATWSRHRQCAYERTIVDMADEKLPRPLRTFPPELWARLDPAQRATFIRLWQRDLRTFTLGQWAQLPSPVRNAVNWLRQERHLSPYPEPEVDRSPQPYVPAPGLLDPSPLTRAVLDSRDPTERGNLWQQLNTAADRRFT